MSATFKVKHRYTIKDLELIDQRLSLIIKYLRLLNGYKHVSRLKKLSGLNICEMESGKRPVSFKSLLILEGIFKEDAIEILKKARSGHGEWSDYKIKHRIMLLEKNYMSKKNMN